MAGVRLRLAELIVGNKETVVSVFLLGALAALGFRASAQQREIVVLETQRSSLRASNRSMSSDMWAWREHLFALAETSDLPTTSSAAVIPLARLRAIYGEEDPILPAAADSAYFPGGVSVEHLGDDAASGDTTPIA